MLSQRSVGATAFVLRGILMSKLIVAMFESTNRACRAIAGQPTMRIDHKSREVSREVL